MVRATMPGMHRGQLLLLLLCGVESAEWPRTSGGSVIGITLPSSAGGAEVDQFLGVPFATAERFQPPVDFRGTYPDGTIHAKMWGPACMQVATDPSQTYGSEDCLKANVWSPRKTLDTKLPVMVFIYGGSNQFGEAEPYNMSALAAFHDVVCVSFNYRTGPLGWMAFQEDVDAKKSTGNWGILDIQSALRWVQREIAAFGGDAARVAIHGQSSGASLVELQYVAPESNGLFRGAISESGSLSAGRLPIALTSATVIAASVGCLTPSHTANKTCMAAVSAVNLTRTTYTAPWSPVADGVTFPDTPEELLRKGLVNDASIVLGAQTNDSNLFLFRSHTKDGLDQPNDRPDGALKPVSVMAYRAALLAQVGMKNLMQALSLYPPDPEDGIRNVHLLGNVESDKMHCALRRRASWFNKARPGRAFTYRFDYWYTGNPNCTAVPNFHLPYLGAAHQDEVTFVLGQPNFMEDGSCCGVWGLTTDDCPHLDRCEACYAPERFGAEGYRAYFNDKEWNFARTVGTFWTNVAGSGDPNCRDASDCLPKLPWPQHAHGEIAQNIVLNASLPGGSMAEATAHGRPELCTFWDSLASEPSSDTLYDEFASAGLPPLAPHFRMCAVWTGACSVVEQ
eukprot:CAMPEP_0181411420 /NCGR_PEP_ID=MMETSP1110-20121109/7868_1 /TAXON_ID=174948 /ORGANISM="Symbiodinium sp., Strain CCMP421" /LENGTH=622 /DNA_ID=CAMNT_0023534043 /DNA_START=25 /DNA_END=1891 /DNA_ORIENTATION=-